MAFCMTSYYLQHLTASRNWRCLWYSVFWLFSEWWSDLMEVTWSVQRPAMANFNLNRNMMNWWWCHCNANQCERVRVVVSTSMSSWRRGYNVVVVAWSTSSLSRDDDVRTLRHRRRRRCHDVDVIMTPMMSFRRRHRGRHLRFTDVVVATLPRRHRHHDDIDT